MPPVDTIRKRIQEATPNEAKYSLMATYLFCARVSEIIGVTCPSDLGKTLARGPKGKDVITDTYTRDSGEEIEVAIWTIKTAKRHGKERLIALPLDKTYEPLTKPLLNYFQKFNKNEIVFPFTRQKATCYAKDIFKKLTYPIESYKIYKDGEIVKQPQDHNKLFRTHALRHLRATELLSKYRFDGSDLSVYGGWTLRSMLGVGGAMTRYTHLRWDHYFPKLLKKRTR